MSAGSDLLDLGWQALLDHHGVSAVYTPSGGQPVACTVLDNGQPEDLQSLGLQVDGISRVVSVTRSQVGAIVGGTFTIGLDTYKVIGVRQRSAQALDVTLGATVIAGRQS